MLDSDDDLNTGIPKEPEPIFLQTLYLSETTKPGLILTFPDAARCIDASGSNEILVRCWPQCQQLEIASDIT
jgi:hypothetical protein